MHYATPPIKLLRNLPDFCDAIVQSDPMTRVRRCHAAFRVPTRFSQHAQQHCALRIHVLCFHLESRRWVPLSPFHTRLRWNPKRPPAWASSSLPKGQRTVVPFCRHRDTSVWGRWELRSFFALWCRDNYILFNRLPDPLGQD